MMRLAAFLLMVSVHTTVSLSADECDGLFVQLVNGKGLQDSDTFSKSDAFAKITIQRRNGEVMKYEFKTGTVQDSNDPDFTKVQPNSHCWGKEYQESGPRHKNGFLPIRLASAIKVKLFDQDGDEGTDDDIESMGECELKLDPAKAAAGELTCSLVKIVDGKKEDAGTLGTLEFLVHDKAAAEELRNKAAAFSPKCKVDLVSSTCSNLQRTCLYSAATQKVGEKPLPPGPPPKTEVKWTHDGRCETLPYYKERTTEEDVHQKVSPKWKLTTYKKGSEQCKTICDTGTQKHCCIATCDLHGSKGNTCKLSNLAPEWYLSSAALEVYPPYLGRKGWQENKWKKHCLGFQGAPTFSRACKFIPKLAYSCTGFCTLFVPATVVTSAEANSGEIERLLLKALD